MENIRKSPGGMYEDVYYDKGDGEYQPLSQSLIKIVSKEVEKAIYANPRYDQGSHRVNSGTWVFTGECLAADVVRSETNAGEVLREMKITAHELHRDHDTPDTIQTIILAERLYASRVMLEMANPSVGDLNEEYVTAWSEDRYVIEQTGSGSYAAYVEQVDMLKPHGDRQKRPMTLYDAAELIMQVEQMRIV